MNDQIFVYISVCYLFADLIHFIVCINRQYNSSTSCDNDAISNVGYVQNKCFTTKEGSFISTDTTVTSYNTFNCSNPINTTLTFNDCMNNGLFGINSQYYYSLNVIMNTADTTSSSSNDKTLRLAIGISIGVIVALIIISFAIYYVYYSKKNNNKNGILDATLNPLEEHLT